MHLEQIFRFFKASVRHKTVSKILIPYVAISFLFFRTGLCAEASLRVKTAT